MDCRRGIYAAASSRSPAMATLLFCLISGFLVFHLSAVAGSPTSSTVRIPLTRVGGGDGSATTAAIAAVSLRRARHLKRRWSSSSDRLLPTPITPLSSHSYGGYSLTLGFGTPPQRIPLVLDTGSDLVWVPCTSSYLCSKCSGGGGAAAPVFLPRASSSVKLVGCRNPKCLWIHSPETLSQCGDCPVNKTVTQSGCSIACPPYTIVYGSGSTGGLLLSESLHIGAADSPGISNFTVGCSLFSSRQPPAGVAGFGRGPASLPSQLGLGGFSYCLHSRGYDDMAGEHGMVELGGATATSRNNNLSFTPLLQNPSLDTPFSIYYYLGLKKITVDGKKVKIPKAGLFPTVGGGGDGGTIIDSGTTFTFMGTKVYEPLTRAIEKKVAGRYNRSSAAEESTGLRLCFSLATEKDALALPQIAFHFKGGAAMILPVGNYFILADSGSLAAACLAIVTDDGEAADGGPAVILGSFQQQNYLVVFDLGKERLGFKQQSCLQSG